jgi:2-aminoadipate transaminase
MFMTVKLPPGAGSMAVFSEGVKEKVAVMPGAPFFTGGGGDDMIRLNFSNTDETRIRDGMARLARVVKKMA